MNGQSVDFETLAGIQDKMDKANGVPNGKRKYHKVLLSGIELMITHRDDLKDVPYPIMSNGRQWRSSIRHPNGAWEARWRDTFEDAVEWVDRFQGIDVVNYITNLLTELERPPTLKHRGLSFSERARRLGALECVLTVLGVFKVGADMPFKLKEDIKWEFFFFNIKHQRRERYDEMVIREAKGFLKMVEKQG